MDLLIASICTAFVIVFGCLIGAGLGTLLALALFGVFLRIGDLIDDLVDRWEQ